MPNYNISVKSSNYNVLSEPQQKYNVGVNYEIPSKYLQYGNEILDKDPAINGQFLSASSQVINEII